MYNFIFLLMSSLMPFSYLEKIILPFCRYKTILMLIDQKGEKKIYHLILDYI